MVTGSLDRGQRIADRLGKDRGQWIGGSNFLTSTHKTWGFWFDWFAGNGSRIAVKGHWFAVNG